jgi:hypothetical protein
MGPFIQIASSINNANQESVTKNQDKKVDTSQFTAKHKNPNGSISLLFDKFMLSVFFLTLGS